MTDVIARLANGFEERYGPQWSGPTYTIPVTLPEEPAGSADDIDVADIWKSTLEPLLDIPDIEGALATTWETVKSTGDTILGGAVEALGFVWSQVKWLLLVVLLIVALVAIVFLVK